MADATNVIKIEKPEELWKFLTDLKNDTDQNAYAIAELAGEIKAIAEYVVKKSTDPKGKPFERTWAQRNPITAKYFK